MRIGYISRNIDSETGREIFRYREGNATRRIGVKTDTVKVKFLYGTTPFDEVRFNTEIMKDGKLMLVSEPFFTDGEMKKKCEKWCEWANSCEHREYSFFGKDNK